MKKLGIGFAILIVGLIGTILVVPSFLNWNEYKAQFEQTASGYTGRDVKIKGDISLSLLPTAALSVKDVTVTNLDGGKAEYIISLKSLDVQVSFPSVISSIFGGRVKVEKFILVDPIIALERMPDGRVNWDLNGRNTAADESRASSADISLDIFQIVNGQISFEDMASGQRELLRKINANVKVKSINGPFEVVGSAKYKGLDAELDLNLGKNRQGKKAPVKLLMALLNNRVKVNMIGGIILNGTSPSFAGKLDVTASDAGDIFVMVDRFNGQKNPAVRKVGQDFALDTLVDVTADKMTVNELNVRIGQSRGQGNGQVSLGEKVNIVATLSVNKLDLDPLLSVFPVSQEIPSAPLGSAGPGGKGPLHGDRLLSRLSGEFDVKLGALKYNDKIASQIALKLLAKAGLIDITTLQARMPGGSSLVFSGQIAPPAAPADAQTTLSGDLSLKASNLRGLLSWLKLDAAHIPSGRLAQFSYQSRLKLTSDLLQLYDIEGELDAVRYKGGVSYALSARPSYGLSLELENLNLDSYRTPAADPDEDSKQDLKKILLRLSEFDADYKITLSKFTVGGVKIRAGQLDGLLLGGQLDAKVIKLDDAAGVNFNASGQGKNFATKPEFSLTLSANAKSLATLQRSIKSATPIIDLRKLGEMKLQGSLSTTLEKMDVDLTSSFGVKKLDVVGTIRSATLKQFPNIGSANLAIDASSTSLAELVDQLELPMAKPRAGDDRPLRLKGRIKASSDLVDIDGKLNIAAGEINVTGRKKGKGAAASLDFTLDVMGVETREFIRGLGIDFQPSAKKLGALALKIKGTGTGDHYVFSNIVGDVGPVKLSGSGQFNAAAAKPVFDFNLKTGDIPLHDFLTEKDAPKKDGKAFGQWTREAMDLSLLSAYEGQAKISAASLTYKNYFFENPTFEAILKEGLLSVNDFTGRLFGGDVALSGSFGGMSQPSGGNKNSPKMTLNMTLKQASLSQATASSAGIAPVTGFFDMSGHYTGEGVSQFDMMSSLAGEGEIIASPGLITGIDIPALSDQLSNLADEGALLKLLGRTLSGGKTPYKGAQSTIRAKDGKIEFSPFDIELDGAKSKIKMAVDILNWTMSTDGWLALADHPNAPPIDVNIIGDISNPQINYSTARLKKYVGAQIASKMLQQLIGDEGGLEGIFGTPKTKNAAPESEPAHQNPEEKPQAAGEFGKRLLEKLFEKDKASPESKPEKQDVPKPEKPNP